jgi:hypothetical protein
MAWTSKESDDDQEQWDEDHSPRGEVRSRILGISAPPEQCSAFGRRFPPVLELTPYPASRTRAKWVVLPVTAGNPW